MADDKPKGGITLDDLVAELGKNPPGPAPKPVPVPQPPAQPKPPVPSLPSPLPPKFVLPQPAEVPVTAPTAPKSVPPPVPPPVPKPQVPAPPPSLTPKPPVPLPGPAMPPPPVGLPTRPAVPMPPPLPAAAPKPPPPPPIQAPVTPKPLAAPVPAVPPGLDVKLPPAPAPSSVPPPKDIPPVSMRTMTLPGQAPLQPVPPLTPAGGQPVVAPKGFRSSIRTMADDISKLKAGQLPKAVEIKPAPAQAPAKPAVPVPPTVPRPPLGAAPLAGAGPLPAPVPAPQVPRPPLPPAPPISIPQTKGGFNKLYLAGILIVLVIAGALYFLLSGEPEAEPVVSPSPTVAVTTPPAAAGLAAVFDGQSLDIALTEGIDAVTAFRSALEQALARTSLGAAGLRRLSFTTQSKGSAELGIAEVFDVLGIIYPPALRDSLGADSIAFVYGQPVGTDGNILDRLAFITELKDTASASQGLSQWTTMVRDLGPALGFTPPTPEPVLLDGTYGTVPLKFVQVPDRYTGLAVAVVGRYLVIASSKDSFEFVVDTLLRQP